MMIALHEGFSFPLQDLVICTQIECVYNLSHIFIMGMLHMRWAERMFQPHYREFVPFITILYSEIYDECMSEEKKKKTSMQILLYMQICDNVILRILCKLAIFIWKVFLKKGVLSVLWSIHWKHFDFKFYCIYTLRLLIGLQYNIDIMISSHIHSHKIWLGAQCIISGYDFQFLKSFYEFMEFNIGWAFNSIFVCY